MPARPTKPTSNQSTNFWDFDPLKKIISGAVFFLGALACVFLLIPYVRSDARNEADLIAPVALALLLSFAALQLARRKNVFVLVLLGIALAGGLGGWGARVYSDRIQAQKLIVLVPRFQGEEEKYAFREKLIAEIREAAGDIPDVEIITTEEMVTREVGSVYAIQLGQKMQADLVVWAWYKEALAPRINLFIEDTSPEAQNVPQKEDPTALQPITSYLRAFTMRRTFTATTDTFKILMSALLNYKSGNYQAYLDLNAQLLANKDISMLLVPFDLNFYEGVTRTLRNETDLSIEAYSRAIAVDRKGAAAYNNRALAYIELGEYSLAQNDCDLALIIDSNYTVAYNTCGIAHMARKDYDRAAREFSVVIANDPEDPRAYHNRALAYQAAGKPDLAALDFKMEAELRAAK